MPTQYYAKIALLILVRSTIVQSFLLQNFLANGGKQVLINGLAQYGGYVMSKSVGSKINTEVLIPFISNGKIAADFIQMTNNIPVTDRIATISLIFSTGGFLTKVEDIPTNDTMGALIAGFIEYISSSVNAGNTPFIHRKSKRLNLTIKQHMQMQILIVALLITILTCSIIIFYLTKRLIQRSRLLFKKSIKIVSKYLDSKNYSETIQHSTIFLINSIYNKRIDKIYRAALQL